MWKKNNFPYLLHSGSFGCFFFVGIYIIFFQKDPDKNQFLLLLILLLLSRLLLVWILAISGHNPLPIKRYSQHIYKDSNLVNMSHYEMCSIFIEPQSLISTYASILQNREMEDSKTSQNKESTFYSNLCN